MKEPLAYRLRPKTISDILGQTHLLKDNSFLVNSIKLQQGFSIIFFGPPGTGKTSLAESYANDLGLHIIRLNGVDCSKKDMDEAINEAKMFNPSVIILDEIHRLNKDKQDYLLPYLEQGSFYLIGATTSNPYLYINKAIRSRCHLLEVKPLSILEVKEGIKRALEHKNGLNNEYKLSDETIDYIANLCGGDLRYALNILDICSVIKNEEKEITIDDIKANFGVNISMDKDEDDHYDAVSALQKSIRGSDVDAALFYLAKLCVAKDLPSIARRLTVIAYEDVGLGNPSAVGRVLDAIKAAENVGFPEAAIPLGFAVCDLALSPKSRAAADSIEGAISFASQNDIKVQSYLKYTPVNVKDIDKYPYDRPDLWEKIQYLPDEIANMKFYQEHNSSKYEQLLNENYHRLNKNKRSNNLRKLKQTNQ